jgi:hypothetical protein
MVRRSTRYLWGILALALLAACGGASTPAGSAPTAAAPTRAAATTQPAAATVIGATPAATASLPTATSLPTAAGELAIPEGRTPEGYHTLGRDDAPLTLVMYSDFL